MPGELGSFLNVCLGVLLIPCLEVFPRLSLEVSRWCSKLKELAEGSVIIWSEKIESEMLSGDRGENFA